MSLLRRTDVSLNMREGKERERNVGHVYRLCLSSAMLRCNYTLSAGKISLFRQTKFTNWTATKVCM